MPGGREGAGDGGGLQTNTCLWLLSSEILLSAPCAPISPKPTRAGGSSPSQRAAGAAGAAGPGCGCCTPPRYLDEGELMRVPGLLRQRVGVVQDPCPGTSETSG